MLVLKVVAALVAAVAAVALGLHASGVLTLSGTQRVAAVVASAVLAAVSTVAVAVRDWRERRAGLVRERVDDVLDGVLWAVVDLLVTRPEVGRLDVRDLGVAAYRLERPWWAPWRPRLRRVHRVRARHRPTAASVDWVPGKGVVGRCVAQRRVVAQDLGAVDEATRGCTREQWDAMPDDVRLGLDFDEHLAVRGRYGVVVAAPVIDDRRAVARVSGCIALDGPSGCLAALRSDDVVGVLESAGALLLRQVART
nr:hypothetical protein [Angustibacter aerolatus]